MKEINLHDFDELKGFHNFYLGVPQPMVSCDSTEELKRIISKKHYIVNGLDSLHKFLAEVQPKSGKDYENVYYLYREDYQLWVATGEKFVPKCWSPTDQIIYDFDANGELIPTDNTYVRVYVLKHIGPKAVLYTSSGVYTVAVGSWRVSAAVKTQYRIEKSSTHSYKKYDERLAHLLNRKKHNVSDMRLFNLIFNPESAFLGDFETAVRKVYPFVRKADMKKVITSQVFAKMFAKELCMMKPDLQAGMLKHFTPGKMSKMFDETFAVAKDKGTIDDIRGVIKDVMLVTYGEPEPGYQSNVPLVEEKGALSPKAIEEKTGNDGIDLFDDVIGVGEKEAEAIEAFKKKSPVEQQNIRDSVSDGVNYATNP